MSQDRCESEAPTTSKPLAAARAWCVAELVRAFYCHIPQRVLLHSDKFLEARRINPFVFKIWLVLE